MPWSSGPVQAEGDKGGSCGPDLQGGGVGGMVEGGRRRAGLAQPHTFLRPDASLKHLECRRVTHSEPSCLSLYLNTPKK